MRSRNTQLKCKAARGAQSSGWEPGKSPGVEASHRVWRKEQGGFLDGLKSKRRLRDRQETVWGGQVGSTGEKWNRYHDTALGTQSDWSWVWPKDTGKEAAGGECDTSWTTWSTGKPCSLSSRPGHAERDTCAWEDLSWGCRRNTRHRVALLTWHLTLHTDKCLPGGVWAGEEHEQTCALGKSPRHLVDTTLEKSWHRPCEWRSCRWRNSGRRRQGLSARGRGVGGSVFTDEDKTLTLKFTTWERG